MDIHSSYENKFNIKLKHILGAIYAVFGINFYKFLDGYKLKHFGPRF